MGRLTAQSHDDVLLGKIKHLVRKQLEASSPINLRYPLEKPTYEQVVKYLDVENEDVTDIIHDLISNVACSIAREKTEKRLRTAEEERQKRRNRAGNDDRGEGTSSQAQDARPRSARRRRLERTYGADIASHIDSNSESESESSDSRSSGGDDTTAWERVQRERRLDGVAEDMGEEAYFEEAEIADVERAGRRARQRRRRLRENRERMAAETGNTNSWGTERSRDFPRPMARRRRILLGPPSLMDGDSAEEEDNARHDEDPVVWIPSPDIGRGTGPGEQQVPNSASTSNGETAGDWLLVPQPFGLPGEDVLGDTGEGEPSAAAATSATDAQANPGSASNTSGISASRRAEFARVTSLLRALRRRDLEEDTGTGSSSRRDDEERAGDEMTEMTLQHGSGSGSTSGRTTIRIPSRGAAAEVMARAESFAVRMPLRTGSSASAGPSTSASLNSGSSSNVEDFSEQENKSREAMREVLAHVQDRSGVLRGRINNQRRARGGASTERLDNLERQIKDFAETMTREVEAKVQEVLREDIARNSRLRRMASETPDALEDDFEVWTNWDQVMSTLNNAADGYFTAMNHFVDVEIATQSGSASSGSPASPTRAGADNLNEQAENLLTATRQTSEAAMQLIVSNSGMVTGGASGSASGSGEARRQARGDGAAWGSRRDEEQAGGDSESRG